MMCIHAYKVSSQTGNPKLYSCHAYLQKRKLKSINFCHYPFPTPVMLTLQTMRANNVNSFIPGVNHDLVHISKSCISIRAAGDEEMKAVST